MNSEQGTGPAVWNRAELIRRLGGDEDLLRLILSMFMEDAPRRIETLRQHLASGNGQDARREAHTLKGASANLDAEAFRRVATEMERLAEAGDLASGAAMMPGLEREFDRLKAAIQAGPNPP